MPVALLILTAGLFAGGKLDFVLPPRADDPRWIAQRFLRHVAAGNYTGACLYVIDDGTVLNPCLDSLPERDDFDTVARLDPDVKVKGAHTHGGFADVTEADLNPRPAWKVSFRMVRAGDDGHWKVRELNGRPIKWEWTR